MDSSQGHQETWIYFTIQIFSIDSAVVKILYTTLTNFSTKYLTMCKVYTDVGGTI